MAWYPKRHSSRVMPVGFFERKKNINVGCDRMDRVVEVVIMHITPAMCDRIGWLVG